MADFTNLTKDNVLDYAKTYPVYWGSYVILVHGKIWCTAKNATSAAGYCLDASRKFPRSPIVCFYLWQDTGAIEASGEISCRADHFDWQKECEYLWKN